MDVYLSARFGRREELLAIARQLEDAGIKVTSRWLQLQEESDLEPDQACYRDLFDLNRAQVLVAFTEAPDVDEVGATRGGRHVELGVALQLRKRCMVVGPRENVFHHHETVERHETAAAAIAQLIADHQVQRKAGW